MRRKIFTIISALLLVLAISVTPMKVAAQGLVEFGNVMVGMGTDQKLELYSYQKGGVYTIIVTLTDDDMATGTCTETVQATLREDPGLKIIRIQMGAENQSLMITEKDEVPLDPNCFNSETKRVIFQIVAPPPGIAKQRASNPDTVPTASGKLGMVAYSVVGPNEETVVVNHLKSKFSSGPGLIVPIPRSPDEE